MNHNLTDEQVNDAKKSLEIKSFISLPDELKAAWRSIPAEMADISSIVDKFDKWVCDNYNTGDVILIQGEAGMTYKLISRLNKKEIKCCYATTKRESKEIETENGIVKTSTFKHVMFRFYN